MLGRVDDLLLDNLKEALQTIQRYMLIGLASAGGILTLAASSPKEVSITGLPAPVPWIVAISIFSGAYWAVGFLSYLTVKRVNEIVKQFGSREDRSEAVERAQVLLAALTYPSMLTFRASLPRVGMSVIPPILAVAGFAIAFEKELLDILPILGMLLLAIPYVFLAWELQDPIGGRQLFESVAQSKPTT
ncbi:MAG: hypothetical protein BZY88_02575 [SAR202 cluster bacterium Io17-Chloro-G9]|nr:MAG: hypothetical protein BZY88_02575 [SAR202 cluster bacterium Io17-Chloro-G9]